MNEQVMIYEVKSGAAPNANLLFSKDSQYFYWNSDKFINLEDGDSVFVVNKTSGWVLFCKFEKRIIEAINEEGNTTVKDNGNIFKVSGKFNKFIRLKIIEKIKGLDNWEWKTLGSSEITYLNGQRINTSNKNRIDNIEQLRKITEDKTILSVLNECEKNFFGTNNNTPANDLNEPDNNNELNNMNDILTAIKTKPFILLAGISGTGKSRLVRTLAYKTCNKEDLKSDLRKPGNFEIIPVKPNWHDSTELMGYVSRINDEKYITTSFLKFIAKAWNNLEVPFFLCLDEMNLAPVEQYFAEYLSIIETRQNINDEIVTDFLISKASFENKDLYSTLLDELNLKSDSFDEGISIPKNLVVIGTVNMDETTHSFSRKVLDRAMTFEMNNVDLNAGLGIENNDWSYPKDNNFISFEQVIGEFTSGHEVYKNNNFTNKFDVISYLEEINTALEDSPFKIAYRVRDEFLIYCYYALKNKGISLNNALDDMTFMKILSRIEGDESKTKNLLDNLIVIVNSGYVKSNKKLQEMKRRLELNGYTSFWS